MLIRAGRVPPWAAALWARLAYHAFGLGLLLSVTVWTMRRFVFTAGIPAGTDMLGFISRAAQNAAPGRLVDAWSPSSFGARRVFTFDSILGAVNLLIANPVVTVKLLDVLLLFGAGLTAYALAWSWYWRRLAATVAGLLYMASQASLTRWGSGQLNVEIIICLAPLMLLTWSSSLRQFTLGRAVAFTFALGIGILIRADLVLYVVPFLVFYAAAVLSTRAGWRVGLANAAKTLAVSVPGVLLLNAAWLLPTLTGYRAQYETLNQIFSLSQLSTRSLDLYSSLLGFGREIGYFGYTGTETWYSFPGLPLWAYYAFATLIPVLAYLALRWHRDRRTVFLVLGSVIATLAAPGGHPPFGQVYLWAVQHLPVFGNLRDPNRWLIVQAIAYALLASLTIQHLAVAATSRRSARTSPGKYARARACLLPAACAFALVWLGLVPVLPTLAIGLRTWHATQSQLALLSRLRDAPELSRVASVPFDQDYRFLRQGSYSGYEHDLGYESALFTGRQDIGDGNWTQRSANFVAYEATLLARRDPAFAALLGTTGVSRLVSFSYPLVAQQLLSQSVGPYTQQHDVSRLPGLRRLVSNPAGTDYAIEGVTAPLSLRRNVAVVLGGTQGIAALADRPGFRLSDWAVFTAGDLIATRGFPEFLALIRKADLVLLADERPVDIAVEGTTALARLVGITSDPQLDRLETNVPTGQSAQTGALVDPATPIPQPQSTLSSSTFAVRAPRPVAIWARVRASPLAATIYARVDGMRVGSVTPLTLGTGGFEWLRMATVRVGAGSHRVTLSASPSIFGDEYEVEQARVLDPGALRSAEQRLKRALVDASGKVGYAFNLADVAKWSWASLASRLGPARSRAFSLRGWIVPAGAGTTVATSGAPGGATAPQFSANPGRSVYAVAKIRYAESHDWAGRPYIYLNFKGSDSGKLYSIAFDFGTGPGNQARYPFTDDVRGWRTLAFPTAEPGPGSGQTDWSRVRSVLIALPSKSESGTFAVGVPRPSRPVRILPVPLPILRGTQLTAAARKPACIGRTRASAPGWLASRHILMLPVPSLKSSCSIYASSRTGYLQQPAMAVRLHRSGAESWSYSFSTHEPGVLVFTQAYDPMWVLSGSGAGNAPLPVLSLLDGYFVGSGHHFGTIAFAGGATTNTGVVVTVVTAVALLLVTTLGRRRRRSVRVGRHSLASARPEYIEPWLPHPPLRRTPGFCLKVGTVLLVLCPVASMDGFDGVLLPLSAAALLIFGIAAVLVAGSRTPALPAGTDVTEPRQEHVVHAIAR